MSLRTPLSRVRGLGPAKDGLRHWWTQRLTAVALVPLSLWFVIQVVSMSGAGYEDVTAWIGAPSVAVMLLLLIFAVFYHAMLGVQVVLEDYVHNEGLKVVCLVLNRFVMFGLGFVAAFSVLRVAFGG